MAYAKAAVISAVLVMSAAGMILYARWMR